MFIIQSLLPSLKFGIFNTHSPSIDYYICFFPQIVSVKEKRKIPAAASIEVFLIAPRRITGFREQEIAVEREFHDITAGNMAADDKARIIRCVQARCAEFAESESDIGDNSSGATGFSRGDRAFIPGAVCYVGGS